MRDYSFGSGYLRRDGGEFVGGHGETHVCDSSTVKLASVERKSYMERFTISLDEKLAHEFDRWIAERNYSTRSEAVRDLLRTELQNARLKKHASPNCVACLSYVFNHHERDLAERLNSLQHDQHDLTVSTMHAHLDHDYCLETVILRGNTDAVRAFSDAVIAERGVHHGKLNLIAVDVHGAHTHQGNAAPPLPTSARKRGHAGDDDHDHHHGEHLPHVHLKPSH